jgi:hypothetical protein
MNVYRHVAQVTREVHDGLMKWSRRVLMDAGYETVEVYGQFPPKGTVSSHIVLFPYRVGPEPKMMENATGVSLLRNTERNAERALFVPESWLELGAAIGASLQPLYPDARPPTGRAPIPRDPNPYPSVGSLPEALRRWYEAAPPSDDGEGWVIRDGSWAFARPPSLWWRPGITISARYIAVANEPGRGTEERTSASPPIALSALSVLAAGVQLERTLEVPLPPLPFPDELVSYTTAMAESRAQDGPEGVAEATRLREALKAVQKEAMAQVALIPVHDLSNHEFALLMQALQRPLQAALNIQIRLTLAGGPLFTPSSFVQIYTRNTSPRAREAG